MQYKRNSRFAKSPRLILLLVLTLIGLFTLNHCTVNGSFTDKATTQTEIEVSQIIRTTTPTHTNKLNNPSSGITTIETATNSLHPMPTPSPTKTAHTIPTTTSKPNHSLDKTSDLLFLSKNELYRWDHVTNFTNILVKNVSEFVVDLSGMHIGIIKPENVAANGEKLFDIMLLDFDSMQLHSLGKFSGLADKLSISPKGNWLTVHILAKDQNIILINTDNTEEIVKLGNCGDETNSFCSGIVWSNDNKKLAWSDHKGIWVVSTDGTSPQLILDNKITVKDPEGNKTTIEVQFNELRWSPYGRFLLAEVSPIDSEVHWQSIIDTRRHHIASIPDTLSQEENEQNLLWLNDGTILLIQNPTNNDKNNTPFIKIWKATPTREDLLILKKFYRINPNYITTITNLPDSNSAITAHWPIQIRDEEILFGITWLDNKTSPVLLSLNLDSGKLTEISKLPVFTNKVFWAPDYSGVLIIGDHNSILYKSFLSNQLLDLSKILSSGSTNFFWLPPKPRKNN